MPANNLFPDLLAPGTGGGIPDADAVRDDAPPPASDRRGSRTTTPTRDPRIWVNCIGHDLLDQRGLTIPTRRPGTVIVNPLGVDTGVDLLQRPGHKWDHWAREGREIHVVVWDLNDDDTPVLPELDRLVDLGLDVTVHGAFGMAGDRATIWTDVTSGMPLFSPRTEREEDVWKRAKGIRATKAAKLRLASESGAPTPRLRSVGECAVTPVQALIHGHLVTGSHNELIAPSGTGKTGLAVDLGLSIATGIDWAGEPVTRGRVVFMVGEGGGDAFDVRVDAWLYWHGKSRADIAGWFTVVDPSTFIGSAHWDALASDVAALRPSLVILDTRTAHLPDGADDSSVSVATTTLGALKKLRDQSGGAATLLIHHPGKQGTSGRGSQAWTDAADLQLMASRKGNRITLTEGKQRHFGGKGRWTFTTDEVEVDHPVFPSAAVVVHEAAARDADRDARAEERAAERKARTDAAADAKSAADRATLLDLVAQANTAGELPTTNELVDKAVALGMQRNTARRVRQAMVDDGTFITVDGPKRSTLHQVVK